MCSGTIYWVGIGRVVFGLAEHDMKSITGAHDENGLFISLSNPRTYASVKAAAQRSTGSSLAPGPDE